MPDYAPDNPETAADIYQSLLIAHQIGLLRVSNTTARKMIELLNRSEAVLTARLHREVEKLGSINALNYSANARRITEMIRRIQEVRKQAWEAAEALVTGELEGIGLWEVDWNKAAIEESIGVALDVKGLTASKVKGIVSKQPFQGRLLKKWFESLSGADQARVEEVIQQGLIEGANPTAMARQLTGTRANKYADGLFNVTRNQADSVVKTAVNHIANRTREDVWRANSDIILGVQWVSVLDGRTTAICRALDGKYAPLPGLPDKLAKNLPRLRPSGRRPPAHFRCRSLVVAIFDPEGVSAKVGVRPYVRSTKTRKGREVDFVKQAKAQGGWGGMSRRERQAAVREVRREWSEKHVGRAPASIDYQDWLKGQPVGFQNELLGKTRGELFRKGNLTVDQFVDFSSGREWSLAELRKRESAAFRKAGL